MCARTLYLSAAAVLDSVENRSISGSVMGAIMSMCSFVVSTLDSQILATEPNMSIVKG